ncbi:MAG TPA: hypothetical protein VKH42_02080 [Vicinamibacterales bacterium]|nr:hypothetical protein [Vicinamibacterales bacterium]
MGTERDRVISISLSEAEWRAFVAQHPQPVTWIQDRIREQLRANLVDADAANVPFRTN